MAMFIDFPEVDVTVQGIEDVTIPSMVKIGESYDASKIGDPCAHLRMRMEKLPDHVCWQAHLHYRRQSRHTLL